VSSSWVQMEVVEIKRQTPTLFSAALTPVAEEHIFHFQAGQCVNVLSNTDKKGCFSIASEPEEKKSIEFLLKDQPGTIAHDIVQLKAGDRFKISPPFGPGFPAERFKQKDLLLIGIGSGLSPLRSLLKSLLRREHSFRRITFLYGVRTEAEIPFKDEFNLWSKKIELQIVLSQSENSEWKGLRGRVTDIISDLNIHPDETICCLCGNKEMEGQTRKLLETKGVSKQNILLNY